MPSSFDFSFHVTRESSSVVVTVRGELDVVGSIRLGAVLGDLIEGQGNLNVVVDLCPVISVDLAGMGVVAAAGNLVRRRGGRLTLSVPSEELYRSLRSVGLTGAVSVVGEAERPCLHDSTPEVIRSRAHGDHGPQGAHTVEFYESDHFLAESVSQYLKAALQEDDSAIVVATEQHRALFRAALVKAGIDVEAAERSGRYTALDAQQTLDLFMVAGAPDGVRFETQMARLITGAAAGSRQVRVYGEMVAVLWAEGNVSAAIALEDLWNELARTVPFSLFCAYPVTSFEGPESEGSFRAICEQHSKVVQTGAPST